MQILLGYFAEAVSEGAGSVKPADAPKKKD
jgi:hypothetical protein